MIKITVEQFVHDPEKYLDVIKPGQRIEIGDFVVLIHTEDFRYLKKCSELVDSLPVGIEHDLDDAL